MWHAECFGLALYHHSIHVFAEKCFQIFGVFLLINYRVGVTKDLRGEMYRKLYLYPFHFSRKSRKGDMMSRMSNDVGEVEGNILGSLVELINAPFMLISTLISLFWLSSELTLFSLLVLPVMGTMIALIGKSLKKILTKHKTKWEPSSLS
ncbi:ABC transporter transmembrane domain-containing protein [Chryseobacterium indoltheticum]|uniref:ABC transporter transmembrane domain-containing protein n=1 Tax=Chryseobacterium indoltheticum TaxID=254 RepID=UPI003F49201B